MKDDGRTYHNADLAWYFPVVKTETNRTWWGRPSRSQEITERAARRILISLRFSRIDAPIQVGIGRGFNRTTGPTQVVTCSLDEPGSWTLPPMPRLP